ncbi:hypothetical protein K7432_007928 [Basidiobolus ranarum]|uniref:SHSP domain-containing protein n=1 Tax=Basidiobolus ranarum TaxID=34480 RepID=A0ABR2VZD0_9FUNG
MSLNRVFTNVFPELRQALAMIEEPFAAAARHNGGAFTSFRSVYSPAIDLSESNTGYILEAELPGVSKDKIEIEFTDDNTLVLKSNVEETNPEIKNEGEQSIVQSDDKKYWTRERVASSFERRIKFPGRVDPEAIKANYKDGILTIDIPKIVTEQNQIKKIAIDG